MHTSPGRGGGLFDMFGKYIKLSVLRIECLNRAIIYSMCVRLNVFDYFLCVPIQFEFFCLIV